MQWPVSFKIHTSFNEFKFARQLLELMCCFVLVILFFSTFDGLCKYYTTNLIDSAMLYVRDS